MGQFVRPYMNIRLYYTSKVTKYPVTVFGYIIPQSVGYTIPREVGYY